MHNIWPQWDVCACESMYWYVCVCTRPCVHACVWVHVYVSVHAQMHACKNKFQSIACGKGKETKVHGSSLLWSLCRDWPWPPQPSPPLWPCLSPASPVSSGPPPLTSCSVLAPTVALLSESQRRQGHTLSVFLILEHEKSLPLWCICNKKSKCSSDPYLLYLQDFIAVISVSSSCLKTPFKLEFFIKSCL